MRLSLTRLRDGSAFRGMAVAVAWQLKAGSGDGGGRVAMGDMAMRGVGEGVSRGCCERGCPGDLTCSSCLCTSVCTCVPVCFRKQVPKYLTVILIR